jgi:glucose-6-phosphate 1-dehydrogenase
MTENEDNPLRSGTRLERTSEPCVVVIFGAAGDLTRRKLVPALYRLARQRLVPAEFAILGTARPVMSDDEFRVKMREALNEFSDEEVDEAEWGSFAAGLFYLPGEFDDKETYNRIKEKLGEIDQTHHTQNNRLFYLATAPEFFGVVARQLGDAGLARTATPGWTRIIVEKPFGHDLASAQALNVELASVFNENQIFRIDH